MMNGKVADLTRYAAKGVSGEKIQTVQLLEGLGMEGDFHASGGERQISLLFLEQRLWLEAQSVPGLCFKRYKENILLDAISPSALVQGTRVKIGEALVEISGVDKHCFQECPLFKQGQPCILAGQNLFAKVIHSGLVRVGDDVKNEE